jgi:hypothetical protein
MCFYNGFYDWNFNENKQIGQSCQSINWTSQLCQKIDYFFIVQNDEYDQNYWLTWLFEMTKMTKTTNWHENINIFLNIKIYLKNPNWTMDNLWLYCWKINKIWVWWMGFLIWCHGHNMSKLRFESSFPWPQSKVFIT